MTFIPHMSDMDQWKQHFTKMAKNTQPKKFYTVSKLHNPAAQSAGMKLISPTSQNVEQAKQELKRQAEDVSFTVGIKPPKTRKRKQSTLKHRGRKIKRKK